MTAATPAAPAPGVLSRVRGPLIVAIVVQAVASACALLPAVAIAEIAGRVAASEPADAWRWAWVAGAGALGALLLAVLANVITHLADADLQLSLRRSVVERLGRMPITWLGRQGLGRVRGAVQGDVGALHVLVAHTALDVTALVVTAVVALGYLLTVSVPLALVSLLPLAAGVALFARAMRGAQTQMGEFGRARAEIAGGVIEFADGIAMVKAFGEAGRAHRRYTTAVDAFADFFGAWVARTTTSTTASWLVVSPAAVLTLVLPVGAALTAGDLLAPVDIVPFLLLAPALAAPVAVIGPRVQAIRTGTEAARSIADVLAAPVEPSPVRPAEPTGATVRLRGVGFSHDGERDAVADVDLDLQPGTLTALVGRSGAGKSTLAALVARVHLPDRGLLTLGGADVRDVDPHRWHRSVGFVLQDVVLLRDTLTENIRLGRPDASPQQVQAAASAAAIHDRIEALPSGYDTVLGEQVELSGGEAQRVSIARALLADPPVLVLDEAVAHVDPDAADRISWALSQLTAQRTVLLVAHDLDSVVDADQIVVLDQGRIVERGTHATLLQADGRYAAMWAAQHPTADRTRHDPTEELP